MASRYFEEANVVDFLLEVPFLARCVEEQVAIKRRGRETPYFEVGEGTGSFDLQNAYEKVEWLTASTKRKKLYCWPCLLFPLRFSSKVWTQTGFDDFDKVGISVSNHSRNGIHLQAEGALRCLRGSRRDRRFVVSKQIKTYNNRVSKTRLTLERLIDLVCFLAKEGLAFRSHDSPTVDIPLEMNYLQFDASLPAVNCSTFTRLFDMLVEHDHVLKKQLQATELFRARLLSLPKDLIQCVESVLSLSIVADMTKAPFISVYVDEVTRNMSTSTLAIATRYVNRESGKVDESFIRFVDISSAVDEEFILQIILKFIIPWKQKIVSQSFGGSPILHSHRGVFSKVKAIVPTASIIQPSGHRLESIISACSSSIGAVDIFFRSLIGFHSILGKFSTNSFKFRHSRGSDIKTLERFVQVAWEDYTSLFDALTEFQLKNEELLNEIETCKNFLKNTHNVLLLSIFSEIFDVVEDLTEQLQLFGTDVQRCLKCVNNVIAKLYQWLSPDKRQTLFLAAEERCKDVTGASSMSMNDEEVEMHSEILNICIDQLKIRFSDVLSLDFVEHIEVAKSFCKPACVSPCQGHNFAELVVLDSPYGDFFDTFDLVTELRDISAIEPFSSSTIESRIQECVEKGFDSAFPQYFRLLCLCATLPIRNSPVDSSFSIRHRIRSYAQSTNHHVRLPELSKLCIESQRLHQLKRKESFYDKVITAFGLEYECQDQLTLM